MAATLHAKINNREKLDKLDDTIQICEEILNPSVPMAIRFSGILTGSICETKERKVTRLSVDDDLTSLQFEFIGAWHTKAAPDPNLLPKRRTHVRKEGVNETDVRKSGILPQPLGKTSHPKETSTGEASNPGDAKVWSSAASGGSDAVVASSSFVDSKGRLVDADGFTLIGKTHGRSNHEVTTGNKRHIDTFIDYETVEFPTALSVHRLRPEIMAIVEMEKAMIQEKAELKEIDYEPIRLFFSDVYRERDKKRSEIKTAICAVANNGVKFYYRRQMVCRLCKLERVGENQGEIQGEKPLLLELDIIVRIVLHAKTLRPGDVLVIVSNDDYLNDIIGDMLKTHTGVHIITKIPQCLIPVPMHRALEDGDSRP